MLVQYYEPDAACWTAVAICSLLTIACGITLLIISVPLKIHVFILCLQRIIKTHIQHEQMLCDLQTLTHKCKAGIFFVFGCNTQGAKFV